RRCTVEHHGMLTDDVFEHVPHLWAAPLDHALRRLDVLGQLVVDQTLHHEGLEQFERHDLGQTALVQLEGRADDDDRTARIVDALAQQVLPEPALLALQHVGQRLERSVARTGHGAASPTVVEQRIDRFLEHALFVVDDDLGRTQVEQSLETVVAVDHAAIQVVEIGGRESNGELTPQQFVFEDLAGKEAAELVEGPAEYVELLVEAFADGHEIALARALPRLELAVLGATLFELGQLFFELFVPAIELDVALFLDGLTLDQDLLFEVPKIFSQNKPSFSGLSVR